MGDRPARNNWTLVALVAAVSAAFIALVWSGALRLEVPGQHWFGMYRFPVWPLMAAPILAVAGLAATLWWALTRQSTRRASRLVLAAVVCAFVCSVGTRISSPIGFLHLTATIVNEGSNSYFLTAVEVDDPLALAREYPERMPDLPLHATTQSPGAVLLHAGLRAGLLALPGVPDLAEDLLLLHPFIDRLDSADAFNRAWGLHLAPEDALAALAIGLLFPLAWALGAIGVHALARRLAGVRPALVVTALYAVTPSLIWYTASIDQLYAAMAPPVALGAYLAGRRGSPGHAALAGLVCGLGVFLNFGFSVMAAAGALCLLLAAGRRRPGVGLAAVYFTAAAAVLLAAALAFGIDWLGVVRTSAQLRHGIYTVSTPRPWLTWLLLNPVEFTIGLGLSSGAVVLAAAAMWRRKGAGAVVLCSMIAALVVLNLTGAARGEWSRMVMFAMPVLLAGAAGSLRTLGLTRPAPAAALVVAQGAYALICYQLFDVWGLWTVSFR